MSKLIDKIYGRKTAEEGIRIRKNSSRFNKLKGKYGVIDNTLGGVDIYKIASIIYDDKYSRYTLSNFRGDTWPLKNLLSSFSTSDAAHKYADKYLTSSGKKRKKVDI